MTELEETRLVLASVLERGKQVEAAARELLRDLEKVTITAGPGQPNVFWTMVKLREALEQ